MTVVGTAFIEIKALGDKLASSVKGQLGPMSQVGDAAERSAGRGRRAFGSMFSSLSQNSMGVLGPIGEVIERADGIGEAFDKENRRVGKALLGIGGAVTGVGVLLQGLGDKDKAAEQQLRAGIEGTGKSYEDYEDQIKSTIKTGERYGQSAAKTMDVLNRLTVATKDPKLAIEDYGAVLNIAALRHQSVDRAVRLVASGLQTGGTAFRQFGLNLPTVSTNMLSVSDATSQLHDAQEKAKVAQDRYNAELDKYRKIAHPTALQTDALRASHEALKKAQDGVVSSTDALKQAQTGVNPAVVTAANALAHAKSISGQADAAANTFTGHIKALTTTLEDHVAVIGQHWGPALIKMGPAMMGIGAILETGVIGKLAKGTKALFLWSEESKIASAATKAWTVIQAAFDAVMDANPVFLVVGAIVALGAAIYLAYNHFKPFRDIVDDVGRFFKTVFLDSLHAVVDAFDWVKGHLKLLGEAFLLLLGPIGMAIDIFLNWKKIKPMIEHLVHDVLGLLDTLWHDMLSGVEKALGAVLHEFEALPLQVMRAIGELIGLVIAGILTLGVLAVKGIADGVMAMVHGFEQLPGLVMAALRFWYVTLPQDIYHMVLAAAGFVGKGVEVAVHWFSTLPGRAVHAISSLGKGIGHVVSSAWSGAVHGVQTGVSDAVHWATTLPGRVVSGISRLGGDIAHVASSAWHSFIDAMTTAASGIWSFVEDLPHRIVSGLGNIGSTLKKAGSDLIHGFIDGIKSMAGELIHAIEETITKHLPGFVKKALGISSPSKVFMDIGQNVTLGMAHGIRSGGPHVDGAIGEVVGRAISGAGRLPAGSARRGGVFAAAAAHVEGTTTHVTASKSLASGHEFDYVRLARTISGVLRETPMVKMDVHPSAGQSEEAIAHAASARISHSFRLGGAVALPVSGGA